MRGFQDQRHRESAENWANKYGGKTKGFAESLKALLRARLAAGCFDAESALDTWRERFGKRLPFVPDAWRFDGDDVVALEVMNTNPLDDWKLSAYCELFWVLDEAYLNLRLVVIDRTCIEREVDLFGHASDTEVSLPLQWVSP